MVRFLRVTGDAGAHDVFPSRWATAVFGNHMIQVQIPPFENLSAILASVSIALENIVSGEFNLLLWQTVEQAEQNDAWHPNF